MTCTLILGGARSGKSTMAQHMAEQAGGEVLFVATAEAGDEEMRTRIEAHRLSRPDGWTTIEATHGLGGHISAHAGTARTVVIDCITLLVSNIFQLNGWVEDLEIQEQAVKSEIEGLIASMDGSDADFIIVSNEIGLGIVPADRISRMYRDALGRANQLLARRADKVYLLVAGIPMVIK